MFTSSLPSRNGSIAAESYWRLSRSALFIALTLHTAFAGVFLALGVEQLVWLNLVSITIYIGGIVFALRDMRSLVVALTWIELIGHALIATRMLGWDSGFQYYMWLLVPLIFFDLEHGNTAKVFFAIALICCYVGAAIWLQGLPPTIALAPTALNMLGKFNIACYLGATGFQALIYACAVGKAERQLHALAATDALTGLANRRRLLEIAAHEIGRARRAHQPLCIILLDIDYFKSINDRFGHAGGDQVLAEVTKVLRRSVRGEDYVARWGGEEFLILMPQVRLDIARAAAERIRITLASTAIAVHQLDTEPLRITVTLGVSEWHPIEDIEHCIARADAAMYRGKTGGRDRVEVSEALNNESSTLALGDDKPEVD